MNDDLNTSYDEPIADFREVGGRTSVIAIFLGMALIAAAILIGKKYAFFVPFLAFSIVMTLLWNKAPRPWIFLVSISAATPIAIAKQQFSCNLIYALWLAVFNMRYLTKLPKWLYILVSLALFGFFASSINWIGDKFLGSILRQGAFAYNFLLAPFILLPLIYFRMEKSRDYAANLQGLLFCLIVPSTLILLSAKLFGTVTNEWEAAQHASSLSEGFLQYRLGKVVVNFLRTEVGFILAALICASTAVTVSPVRSLYRVVAGACLALNVFLLLSTGSFGSGFACLFGLAAIFYALSRTINVTKAIVAVAVICSMLLLTYGLSPPSVKEYLEKRYEHRVVNKDTDRLGLWERAIEYYVEQPLGVGFTFTVGDSVKTVIHNDYLAYTVSYSVMGGLAYTLLVAGLLVSFFQRRKNMIDDPSALAVYLAGLGVIVAAALNSITDHMAENRWYFNLIWSVIWYSYFCSRAAQREKVQDGVEC
ncbi:O-antigen ligase family protein [Geobacter argillaceus]|uniref:O-antigen ligase-like membrane protein n=1 Tax=Geobacter argillaceus TaxID=345631 RepID=A0A562VME0_9BACT|nr:hypothetical protein [Geobacter argillaceus]TWJ19060.1 hypothetical protein JN12_02006 [Geobacter argillaceus]